jgi:hypothetical protein
MKILIQHGSNAGDKVETALSENLADGVIFSPRDITFIALQAKLQAIKKNYPKAEKYFDPQFYATFLAGDSDSRLGNLLSDGYNSYFRGYRRSQLESEKVVEEILRSSFEFQKQLEVDAIIAPNILVHRSFDSIYAFISKNFVRMTRTVFKELKINKPVYATIAISRDALCDKKELEEFIKDITALKDPPDGFYVLVASQSPESRLDIYNADVIAGWMRINHSLKLNGFKVLNGYSDILSPFLGAAGADAGATGWWSNLRTFSLSKFEASEGGGRLPNQRYLSNNLLNRITYFELDALREQVPKVLNGLSRDDDYDKDKGSMPERNVEVFQSWEALKAMASKISGKKRVDDIKTCLGLIDKASKTYDLITSKKIRLEPRSNGEHLASIQEAIKLFCDRAEIQFPKY